MVPNHKWLLTLLLLVVGQGSFSQSIRTIKYPELEQILNHPGDSTLVVNFWATWCLPCVSELPHFEKVSSEYASSKVKVILISLDAASLLKRKVQPFIAKRGIRSSQVVLLDETDYNAWIDKVSPSWSGAIPFTLIISYKQKKEYERPFTEAELMTELKPFIQ
jgi:thiol-disulfide isomerase/thioredoxin